MICSNCGAHLEKDDKFCVNCGQSVFDNPKTKTEHNFNSQDRQCPKCHKVVNVDDKFCINCGHSLQQTLSNSNDNIASHTYSNTKPEIENETADHIRLTEEAKHLFNNTTKSIGRLAGNDESLKLNLRDMFSEVFKSHTKDEADDVFIAGTKRTTPHINEVSEEWGRPWVFSRVFLALGITFLALWILTNIFGNAIPGMIFIGALLVPISGLIFFFESNAFKNISIFDVMRMFFIGGVLSLISTMILYQFVTFSTESQYYGIMTITDAFIVGFVEELGKATVVILFINYLKTNKILNGLLIGAAVGAGFAVFESAGYIFRFGFNLFDGVNNITEITIQRGWTALGSHLVWAAIVGAAAVIVKETKHFEWANIIDKRFIFFFFVAVTLHGIWDTEITLLSSGYLKYILLIMIAWLFIFILMKAGLTQVNQLRDEYNRLEER
ncbi:PrsW family glutamic-type intramembrane protease [Staphylococcus epidermidis]|uniref:PrsW family glutamic-type intramembrane protease n=1 Tax=Staphylococcus epidermidis TaxID=1282 RepID=UPI001931E3CA|nr:PrsW family glutamic-type intramembrane protease [Staphylococcus epidermidis]MBM0824697.1 PrsW family intramembrane metalloprotease [Staphylococcus epidermidis]